MFSVERILRSGSLLLIGFIVFAESGLLVGFFLPGDTLLMTAGIFAAQDKLPLLPLILTIVISAIVGDNVGYSIGRRTGPRVFKKPDGIFFRSEHIERAEKFYNQHGGKTIILARFIPVVRTFAPVVAGVAKMPRSRFMFFNVFGGVLWGAGVTLLGFAFGSRIPDLDHYMKYVFVAVTILTFGPALYHLFKDKDVRHKVWVKVRLFLRNVFLNKKID